MHWVEGGVYPRYDQQHCLDEFQRTGDLLQPMTKLGHVAVSGMTRYRSTHLGTDYQNNVFITLFNTHKVIRSVLTRSGATFTTKEEDFLVSDDPDFHPTDVLEDADGSLLVIDTGGWFRLGCPTSKISKPDVHGAIYRIRRDDAPKVERSPRPETWAGTNEAGATGEVPRRFQTGSAGESGGSACLERGRCHDCIAASHQ